MAHKGKVRLWMIAKAIHSDSKTVLAEAHTLNLGVKSSSSALEPCLADALVRHLTNDHEAFLTWQGGKPLLASRKDDVHNNVLRRFMVTGPYYGRLDGGLGGEVSNPADGKGERRTWLILRDVGSFAGFDGMTARHYECVNLVSGNQAKVAAHHMTNLW